VGVPVIGFRRLAIAVVGALLVLGFAAASAPSQSSQDQVELHLATAGPGTIAVSPEGGGDQFFCKVEGQQPQDSGPDCDLTYDAGTRVTLEATPDDGASFAGWSDFACRQSFRSCTITLNDSPRYVTARFSPVTLTVYTDGSFGRIKVTPSPRNSCSINDGDACEYARGKTVTLSREHGASKRFWIGACNGNDQGTWDGNVCRLRLTSDEVVGAGYTDIQQIPPPLGSGITVVVAGRGKVTGRVINGSDTLSCPGSCTISGLTRYDYVTLRARGSNFYRWSNGSTAKIQPAVPMASVNRIQAVFR
jgi:Divergent InlB B-repeat domain